MRRLSAALVAATLAAGCAAAGATPPAATPYASPPSPTPTAGQYDVGTKATDLILKIESGGGLVPYSYLLTAHPAFALYGDGRIVVPGPMIEIYPSPLLPNLRLLPVTPAEIQKIVAAADAAGLLDDRDYTSQVTIMDAPSTIVTLTVGGKTHVANAYALGLGRVNGVEGVETGARADLLKFRNAMGDLAGFLGRAVRDTEAYEATSWRVFTAPVGNEPPAQDVTPQIAVWPLADPTKTGTAGTGPASGMRCHLLSGEDLAKFLAAARTANVITRWEAPSGRYSVTVRPLYPDESGCPTAAS